MAIVLELHDICDNTINKNNYQIGRRKKTDFYYLITKDRVNEINDENSDKNEDLNEEILDKIEEKYNTIINSDDFDWETKMSRIPFEEPEDNEAEIAVTFEEKKEYFTGMMKFDYEREFAPEHYINYKPRLIKSKKTRKEHLKMIKEMCYVISEPMDEWLQEFNKNDNRLDENNKLEINFNNFCIDEMHGLCLEEMLNTQEELIKVKVERENIFSIPEKPKPRKRHEVEPDMQVDYEEESEPDDDTEDGNADQSVDNSNSEDSTSVASGETDETDETDETESNTQDSKSEL